MKLFLSSFFSLSAAVSVHAATIQVPANYPTIQAAIDAAANGDTVLVAPGPYFERIDLKGKAITLTSTVGSTNTFILSDGDAGAIVSCVTGETANCVIEGFTIYGANGPGIAITSASPVFKFCAINQNYNSAANGGGVAFTGTAGSPRFEDCQFFGNRADGRDGGAMALSATDSTMTCVRCTFSSNEAVQSFGGAIWASGTTLSLTECSFLSNAVTAWNGDRRGGAIYSTGSLTATNCTFSGNRVEVTGDYWYNGTMAARGGAVASSGPTSLTNCVFETNAALGGGGGCCPQCNWYYQITRAFGGALYLCGTANVSLNGCSFSSNYVDNLSTTCSESRGGAIAIQDGCDPNFNNCTFIGNTAASGGYGAGGSFWYDTGSFGVMTDCTISGSSAFTEGGAIFLNGGANPLILRTTFSNCSTTASNSNGGALRAQDAANPFLTQCRFTNCSSPNGGAIYTHYSRPFISACTFEANTSASGSAIMTAGAGMSNVPTIVNSFFCGNSGTSNNWIVGNWNSPNPASNSLRASCGVQLRTEIVPIVNRSDNGTTNDVPGTAVCYRLYAEFTGPTGAIWGVYGNQTHPMVIESALGFVNAAKSGDVTSEVPCSIATHLASQRYDSWITIGAECEDANLLQVVGFPEGSFLTSSFTDNDCGVIVTPGSSQGVAGSDGKILIAQLTTRNGLLPTGKFNLVGRNNDGSDLLAFAQSWPAPSLVDCNLNGVHDAYDIRDGVSLDCDESGVPDSCEFANPSEDCNNNNTPDLCDIQSGTSADVNGNNVPDECECEGDVDGDGTVNIDDIIEVILAWGDVGPNPADLNGDQVVNAVDLGLVLTYYGSCQ